MFSGGIIPALELFSDSLLATTPTAPTDQSSDLQQVDDVAEVLLPTTLAGQLHQVNRLQQAYDQVQAEITELGHRLFSDWYKYMVSKYPPDTQPRNYPDIDQIQSFIQSQDIARLEQRIEHSGELHLHLDSRNNTFESVAASPTSSGHSLAVQLAAALDQLYADAAKNQPAYSLQAMAAPRYWQPAEPVVFIAGLNPGTEADATTAPLILSSAFPTATAVELESLAQSLPQALAQTSAESTAFVSVYSQNARPVMLEWAVEAFPLQHLSNLNAQDPIYQPTFITDNYQLAAGAVDLSLQSAGGTAINVDIYRGRCLLSSHLVEQFDRQLSAFIEKYPPPTQTDANPQQTDPAATVKAPDIRLTAQRARQSLPGLHGLSQTLSGFNASLLMRRQTLQLAISDPLQFSNNEPFTQSVRQAVGRQNRLAPEPLNHFQPIRSGKLKIQQLRLLDTFGGARAVPVDNIIASQGLTDPQDAQALALPPRVVQPLRLNFRWLTTRDDQAPASSSASATTINQQTEATAASSPIHGWIVPNFLDNSLMFYAGDGQALGSVTPDPDQPWQAAPGDSDYVSPATLPNTALQQVAQWLVSGQQASLSEASGQTSNSLLNQFISVIERSLATIAPAHGAAAMSLALLMGKPLVIVRASVQWQLQGLPATDHGWNAFRQNLLSTTRDMAAFPDVLFPIALGDTARAEDGLVGYWIETADGYAANTFYATSQTDNDAAPDSPYLKTPATGSVLTLNQSLQQPPTYVTMLLDPHAAVHATTGVVPVKTLKLPSDCYTRALRKLAITFLTAPLITAQDQLRLSLPTEPGYHWSWWAKQSGLWAQEPFKPFNTQPTFSGPKVVREGWATLKKDD